jgi:hypothetical protein
MDLYLNGVHRHTESVALIADLKRAGYKEFQSEPSPVSELSETTVTDVVKTAEKKVGSKAGK